MAEVMQPSATIRFWISPITSPALERSDIQGIARDLAQQNTGILQIV